MCDLIAAGGPSPSPWLGMTRRGRELGSALDLKLFQHPVDDGQCGSRLLCRENERWMDPDSWGVTHHDQAFCQTAFEELNAFLFLEQRFGLLIGHEIESDQQSFSTNFGDRAMPDPERFQSSAKRSSDHGGILHQLL